MTHILFIKTLILFGLLSCLISSCDDETCEEFDFNRIPFDTSYYKQKLTYVNEVDTFVLFPQIMNYSRESKLNPMANPECNPSFTIRYTPQKAPALDILYSFEYSPKEKYTEFYFIINSSDLKLKINPSSFKHKKILFQDLHHLNKSDSTRMIKSVMLENMRIIEFETYSGVKWKLTDK